MVKVEQRIRIRLRGFDYRVLDQSVAEIVETDYFHSLQDKAR